MDLQGLELEGEEVVVEQPSLGPEVVQVVPDGDGGVDARAFAPDVVAEGRQQRRPARGLAGLVPVGLEFAPGVGVHREFAERVAELRAVETRHPTQRLGRGRTEEGVHEGEGVAHLSRLASPPASRGR